MLSDRESTQQSNVFLAFMYSCFIIYIKGQKNQCTKQKRTESMVLALVFIPVFYPKKVGALKLCVRNKLEPKQHTQGYEIRVGYIYYVDVQYQKEKKTSSLQLFWGIKLFNCIAQKELSKKKPSTTS